MNHTFVIETLCHFNCGQCNLWWSVADFPKLPTKETIFCPHCGAGGSVSKYEPRTHSGSLEQILTTDEIKNLLDCVFKRKE